MAKKAPAQTGGTYLALVANVKLAGERKVANMPKDQYGSSHHRHNRRWRRQMALVASQQHPSGKAVPASAAYRRRFPASRDAEPQLAALLSRTRPDGLGASGGGEVSTESCGTKKPRTMPGLKLLEFGEISVPRGGGATPIEAIDEFGGDRLNAIATDIEGMERTRCSAPTSNTTADL